MSCALVAELAPASMLFALWSPSIVGVIVGILDDLVEKWSWVEVMLSETLRTHVGQIFS